MTTTERPLTQLEFSEADHDLAEKVARSLVFTQYAYTSTSALIGLFCLPDRASQTKGCIIVTKELGMLFVQDLEDLHLDQKGNLTYNIS